jgi:hypothetical protein
LLFEKKYKKIYISGHIVDFDRKKKIHTRVNKPKIARQSNMYVRVFVVLLRVLCLLIGKPASGDHADPAAGQTAVFGRTAEACDGRCICLRPWLIHVDRRHCNHAADAWAILTCGTPHSGLVLYLKSVSETRGIRSYS